MTTRGFLRRGSIKRTELLSTSSQSSVPSDLPPLSTQDKESLIHQARDAYVDLFHAVQVSRSKGSNGTHLEGVSEETGSTVWMCTTTALYGTIEEVGGLYLCNDSHFSLDFTESKRLYELESPSHSHPLRCTAVRWSKWTGIASVVKDRDFVFLECMDSFQDQTTGFRGWARMTKSIELLSCPPSQNPNGPRRGELLVSGKILRETGEPGVLELITLTHVDIKRAVPVWVRKTVIKSKLNALNLNHVLKLRRVMKDKTPASTQQTLLFRDSRQEVDRRACHGCHDHIPRWTRTQSCRECNETICQECAVVTYYNASTRELKNRICTECSVLDARQRILQAARELKQRQEAEEATQIRFVPHTISDEQRDRSFSSFQRPASRSVAHTRSSDVYSHSRTYSTGQPTLLRATSVGSDTTPTSQGPAVFDLSYLQNYAAPKQKPHSKLPM